MMKQGESLVFCILWLLLYTSSMNFKVSETESIY